MGWVPTIFSGGRLLGVVSALCLMGSVPAAGPQVRSATPRTATWQKLFNGRDLDGWEVVNTGRWTVEDGAIVMRRLPNDSGGGWLVTRRDFGNFTLRLKFLPGKDEFNSGILIRDPGHAKTTRPALNGFEIKLAQGDRVENANGTIWYAASAYFERLPAAQWTQIEIRCEGDHIVTFLNGRKMAETHSRRSYVGAIGLHLHGGHDQPECRWKDIEVEQLPDSPPGFQLMEEKLATSPGETIPLAVPRTGADPSPSAAAQPAAWVLRDGILAGVGGQRQQWLMLPDTYRDFVLSFDFRISRQGDAGVVFRAGPPSGGGGMEAAPEKFYEFHIVDGDATNPPASITDLARAFMLDAHLDRIFRSGQWNQARIYVAGDHIATYLNLEKEADAHDSRSAEGRIGFRVGPGASVEWKNMTIKRVASGRAVDDGKATEVK